MRLRALAAMMAALLVSALAAPTLGQAPADTLTVTRLSNFPTCFHPICFQTGNQYMNLQLLFNTLVKVEADEKTYIPDLADEWQVSPDATTFTFKLNPNAKWHDGTPVTADDVIFTATQTAQFGADPFAGSYPITNWLAVEGAAEVLGTTDTPTGIHRVDDNTVEFKLAAPNAVWLRNLTDPAYSIMPRHLLEGLSADDIKASGFTNGDGTIGSGPYKMVSFTPDVAIEYAANADYHKGAPGIPKLIYRLGVESSTAAAQIQTGELDMVFDLTPSDFDVLDGVEGINVQRVPGVGQQSLQYPTTNPLVADKRVRQAIYYGFDRKTLLETVFQGAGQLLWMWLGFDETDPDLDRYEFDPDRARELIAEAQAAGAFDPAAPFRIIYIQDEPGWSDIAAALEHDLRNIGLNPVLEPADGPGWEAKLPDATSYELSLQCCGSNLYADKAAGAFNCEAPTFGTFYANCEMDQLFRDARETGDAAEQAAIYKQIGQILSENVPYNWLWAVANTHANRTRVSGFEYYPNARESFAQIEKWALAE